VQLAPACPEPPPPPPPAPPPPPPPSPPQSDWEGILEIWLRDLKISNVNLPDITFESSTDTSDPPTWVQIDLAAIDLGLDILFDWTAEMKTDGTTPFSLQGENELAGSGTLFEFDIAFC